MNIGADCTAAILKVDMMCRHLFRLVLMVILSNFQRRRTRIVQSTNGHP
jgi:hypothetical protein